MTTQTRTPVSPRQPPAEVTESFLSNDDAMALATAEPDASSPESKPTPPQVPAEETAVEPTEEAPVETEADETETETEEAETEETEVPEGTAPAPAAPVAKVRRPPQDEAVKAVQIAKDREIAQLKARLAQVEETRVAGQIESRADAIEAAERQRLNAAGYSEDDAKSIAKDRAQLARQQMQMEHAQQRGRAEIVEQAKVLTAAHIAQKFGLADPTVLHQYDSPQAMELAAENMQLKANTVKAKRAKVTAKSPENRFDGAVSASGSVASSQRDLARYNEGARDPAAVAAIERLMRGD